MMWPSTWALSVETCDRLNHHLRAPIRSSPARMTPMMMKTVRRELLGAGFGGAAGGAACAGRVLVSDGYVVLFIASFPLMISLCETSLQVQTKDTLVHCFELST